MREARGGAFVQNVLGGGRLNFVSAIPGRLRIVLAERPAPATCKFVLENLL